MKTSIQHKLENLAERFDEIAALLSEPEIQNDQNKFRALGQEYAQITPIVECYNSYQQTMETLESASQLANDEDPELRDLAREEILEAKKLFILRFKNEEIENNINASLIKLKRFIDEQFPSLLSQRRIRDE